MFGFLMPVGEGGESDFDAGNAALAVESATFAGTFVSGAFPGGPGIGRLIPAFVGGAGAFDGVPGTLETVFPPGILDTANGDFLVTGAFLVGGVPIGAGFFKLNGFTILDQMGTAFSQSGIFFCSISLSWFSSTFRRVLPLFFKSSIVLQIVSVIHSCVFSEPPMMENSSAPVTRLCPSSQSNPMPIRCVLAFSFGLGVMRFIEYSSLRWPRDTWIVFFCVYSYCPDHIE